MLFLFRRFKVWNDGISNTPIIEDVDNLLSEDTTNLISEDNSLLLL